MKIGVAIANIVKQADVEALVNSANANLRLGSGVAGAIHTAAGLKLEEYCRPFAPLALGAALLTPGFKLPNKWIIHVRSAHYLTQEQPEAHMAKAMESMLQVAADNRIRSLAMPAIGTGMYKFPPMLAARITARALQEFSQKSSSIDLVRICVINDEFKQLFESALSLSGVALEQQEKVAAH